MWRTWRWFGPDDRVTLADARQAGAEGVVTALHHIPPGMPWTPSDIARRHSEIATASSGTLTWDVVESLPVSEAIKTRTADWGAHVAAYRASMEALAASGVKTICYNFMPVLDWTRTDLRALLPGGGTAMRFDLVSFAAFDLHILARPNASADYPPEIVAAAGIAIAEMDDCAKSALSQAVLSGLPGAAESWSLDDVRAALDGYASLSFEVLRQTHVDFLSEVVPLAEQLGLRLCCHPDDPPFSLLGLPRTMSTLQDYQTILRDVDSTAFGVTFCTGSFGARPDNDCVAMARALAPRIHFVHLRNVIRETSGTPCSFIESEHLVGDVDMVGVVEAILEEEARRRDADRADAEIPMRPDHGHHILTDIGSGAQPGYPAVGRLKGMAELRGVMAALRRGAA